MKTVLLMIKNASASSWNMALRNNLWVRLHSVRFKVVTQAIARD